MYRGCPESTASARIVKVTLIAITLSGALLRIHPIVDLSLFTLMTQARQVKQMEKGRRSGDRRPLQEQLRDPEDVLLNSNPQGVKTPKLYSTLTFP